MSHCWIQKDASIRTIDGGVFEVPMWVCKDVCIGGGVISMTLDEDSADLQMDESTPCTILFGDEDGISDSNSVHTDQYVDDNGLLPTSPVASVISHSNGIHTDMYVDDSGMPTLPLSSVASASFCDDEYGDCDLANAVQQHQYAVDSMMSSPSEAFDCISSAVPADRLQPVFASPSIAIPLVKPTKAATPTMSKSARQQRPAAPATNDTANIFGILKHLIR